MSVTAEKILLAIFRTGELKADIKHESANLSLRKGKMIYTIKEVVIEIAATKEAKFQ